MQESTQQRSEDIDLIVEAVRFIQADNRKTTAPEFDPYGWQQEFYAAGHDHPQRMIMAANRVGKTSGSTYELACHLTGLYSDDWVGVKFEHAPKCWALGVSGEQIRDVLQAHLFGKYINQGEQYFDGTGWVPNELVTNVIPYLGVGALAKDVHVRHASGEDSTLSFKSYSQGQGVLMGNEIDFILIDEEPVDIEIYPQCLIRTLTGNRGRGGYMALAMTPENGVTELVRQYMDSRAEGQYLVNVTWDDAPHLSDAAKAQMLESIPVYQRDMRTKGIPVLGSGRIFPLDESEIKYKPHQVQFPEYFVWLGALDFGWDHPTAAVLGAWDRDTDIVYITQAYKKSEATPLIHSGALRPWGDWIPWVWPRDGLQHDKGSGQPLADIYRGHGLLMEPDPVCWEDGSYGVEAGLMDMLERMETGRLKVAEHLAPWFEEFRLYHRENGKVVKEYDDLMSATRYLIMGLRFATAKQGRSKYSDWGIAVNG